MIKEDIKKFIHIVKLYKIYFLIPKFTETWVLFDCNCQEQLNFAMKENLMSREQK